jgi:(heptosyl)LPS beta-1,4-glucosyltransferase
VVVACFRPRLADPDPERRAWAWTGIALGLGLAVAGTTEAVLGSLPAHAFLAAALAVPYGADAVRRRAELAAPVTRRHTLSATIITKNEADRLRPCLDSLAGWADEIVVLDSGSTDGTVAIAREVTDRVWVTDWPGFGAQKQRAVERATGDWVLSIDADEIVSPELRHDVDRALASDPPHVGYKTPWAVTVYGKRLDFGRSARAPLRLFRREGAKFTETHVHERVVLPPGTIGTLEGRLVHHSHRDWGHALEKSAKYAWLGARDRLDAGARGGGLVGAFLRAVARFVQVWILRFGFLDGRVGFLIAMGYAWSSFSKYAGLWTLEREREGRQPPAPGP